MPRLSQRHDVQKAVLVYCLEYNNYNTAKGKERLAKMSGMSVSTLNARLRNPHDIELKLLMNIIRGVPLSPGQVSKLLGGLTWETESNGITIKGT